MRGISPLLVLASLVMSLSPMTSSGAELKLTLRHQIETQVDSQRYHRLTQSESWDPKRTAIIVCDMWDLHHCLNAVRRVNQIAPRLNHVLNAARKQGVTIIHAPSDCMAAYAQHAARKRAQAAPPAAFTPPLIKNWCSAIPNEERAEYPIDQTDGGEDDDPLEHAQWVEQLERMGRNPGMPWQTQNALIEIDAARDYISDRGDEVWNVLEQNKISHVILTGVHTNMCVVGRPFGLRQMARAGKRVVLMRDMTDTMYNPRRWPFVSHFTGTDRIIDHIERFICPTITSDQFVGGAPLRFRGDTRPHVVMLLAEKLYETPQSLTQFARDHLGTDFRVSLVYNQEDDPHDLRGIEAVATADLLLVSVRRRALPTEQLAFVRAYVAAGKPMIGLRTASHAFSLRRPSEDPNADQWETFDTEVWGGNYQGHHANDLSSIVKQQAAIEHPVLTGVKSSFPQGGSLYKNHPLPPGTTVLLTGYAEQKSPEPVAWSYTRADGGRSFYTSLGHPNDFANANFVQLLNNAIRWSLELPTKVASEPAANTWRTVVVPSQATRDATAPPLTFRTVVHIPSVWQQGLSLTIPGQPRCKAWLNGAPLRNGSNPARWAVPASAIIGDDANLLVLQLPAASQLNEAPVLRLAAPEKQLVLAGRWQVREGNDAADTNLPLPAKFAAASNIIFAADEPVFSARPFTDVGRFTPGIEGPACDADGNVYAVNYAGQGTIGRVRPDGSGEVFVTLPTGSVGNGIRFDRDGNFYVADYTGHNVLHVNVKTKAITKFAHNPEMNQPNDLAISPNGTLYASDPNWAEGTGQVWRIDKDGSTHLVAPDLGTTNGIEVSPDGKTLYVNESVQRNIWAFAIQADGSLANKRLLKKYGDFGFDGMRCDEDGNLFVTRYGKGTVVKLSPAGETLAEINVLGAKPSNLCFSLDGKTIFVTEVESTRLVRFRVK